MLTLILMAWGRGSEALTERFGLVRGLWPEDGSGQTYQGFIKAWRKVGLRGVYAGAAHLRQRMAAWASARWQVEGWCALAVDGSRFELPRTAEHERVFGLTGKNHGGPQLWVTLLWHLGLGLPWAWKIGGGNASERQHLRGLLKLVPPQSLLVMDGGFVGYELLKAITAGGQHLLLRVGRNVELLRQLGYVEVECDGTVYLWPNYAQRRQDRPLVLRLIRLPRDDDRRRKMYLLTSVLDPQHLTDVQAQNLYRRRWGIELAYRTLKQTLEARKLRSHAPVGALLEMHGLLLGLMLLGLWTEQAVDGGAGSWSPAAALRLVRHGWHRPERRCPWRTLLSQARPDAYRRHRKVRVVRARKKAQKPPAGRPRLRGARPAERRLALSLLQQ